MKLVLIGPPASGKGTISELLGQHYKLPVVNAGSLLREITEDSIWYQPIHDYMDNGLLVPESISGGFLDEVTKDKKYNQGYILDGWLRQMEDMDYFDPKPDFVIYLNITEQVSMERVSSRLTCPKCGKSYNLLHIKPKFEGICDIDNEPLIRRTDDELLILEKRFKVFHEKTLPVITYFKRIKRLIEVDASKNPEIVYKNVISKIGNISI